jgi:glutamate N-acetyltransferase/amino-acid N-acetyltransferase
MKILDTGERANLVTKFPAASAMPRGFSFASVHCGLKKRKLDLGLLVSENHAAAAAMFTTNRVQAAPVIVSREHVARASEHMRAIIVNSGNANCSTGSKGLSGSRTTAIAIALALGCMPEEVVVCSTGVIGLPLDVAKIVDAVPDLVNSRALTSAGFEGFAHAILTTDIRPKWAAAKCLIGGKEVRLLGCTKGAGMIQPNMATMLAFLVTDASLPNTLLDSALREVVSRTFNRITVDGDTSTNDAVVIFANGASGTRPISGPGGDWDRFCAALESVCKKLALAIVEDGEGAQRVVEIEVRGASSNEAAEQVARTIANSPLVKTAIAGADPNWGRILAAAGRSGVEFDPDQTEIRMAGIKVYERGTLCAFDEQAAHQKLLAKYIPIVVDLDPHSDAGSKRKSRTRPGVDRPGTARVWTCDFTAEYIRINSNYRS